MYDAPTACGGFWVGVFLKKCTSDVTATYSLKENGKINVLNTYATKDGHAYVNGEAYATNDSHTK